MRGARVMRRAHLSAAPTVLHDPPKINSHWGDAMKIIDAQVHIWSQTVVPTSGLHRKVNQFTAEDVLKEMDEAGVDAALIHPPLGWDPNANVVAIEAVKKYPNRFAILGNFPLQNPENRKLIHGWRKQPGMMGLRWPLLLEEHQRWLYDGS